MNLAAHWVAFFLRLFLTQEDRHRFREGSRLLGSPFSSAVMLEEALRAALEISPKRMDRGSSCRRLRIEQESRQWSTRVRSERGRNNRR